MFAAAPAVYAVGVILHFSADMQKHTALKLRPGELIDDGLFAMVRNVIYFGELLDLSELCCAQPECGALHRACGICALRPAAQDAA